MKKRTLTLDDGKGGWITFTIENGVLRIFGTRFQSALSVDEEEALRIFLSPVFATNLATTEDS